ncbi:hypothetical protein [Rhizomonospora bruguierae]|uniref:hypothetical protein n=1 Tax=Rhizomonospora bruguierae TaxID=1581705 RepID=UPI001BCA9FF3|nr:hypothetical protein [Micromonospora sp. NBRC 107566]
MDERPAARVEQGLDDLLAGARDKPPDERVKRMGTAGVPVEGEDDAMTDDDARTPDGATFGSTKEP